MELEEVEYAELTPELRAQLEGDESDPWEMDGMTLAFRRKEGHVALRDPSGRLAAQVGHVLSEIRVGDARPIPVVGIGGVIVRRDLRGRGLSLRIIARALERAEGLGPPIALLFCLPSRVGLYRRFGFVEVPPPVLVGQPGGAVAEMPLVTMWRGLRDGVTLPEGQLTVVGLPF